MLQDKSPDYENTWNFLKTQLDDAAAVYSCIQQSEQASQLTKEISQATFTTVSMTRSRVTSNEQVIVQCYNFQARNILGLNWKR